MEVPQAGHAKDGFNSLTPTGVRFSELLIAQIKTRFRILKACFSVMHHPNSWLEEVQVELPRHFLVGLADL